ncbi:MAG: hypothetical protein WCJ97_06040 [Phycisphaerae bacterium]
MSDDEKCPESTSPAVAKNTWLKIFHHPLFGIICAIIGVLGTVLTVYSIYAGQRSRELTYSFNPVRTELVNLGETSSLTVSYDGKPVKNSVTAIQCLIWNAGNEPIRAEDILEPIAIKAPKDVKILEVTVRHASRPQVKFLLNSEKMSSGVIELTWRILEQNDGASVQIVFEGDHIAPFNIEGTIVGQKHIMQHNVGDGTLRNAYEERAARMAISRGLLVITLLPCLSVLVLWVYLVVNRYHIRKSIKLMPADVKRLRQLERMRPYTRFEILMMFLVVIITCWVIIELYRSWWNGIPFDF